MSSLVRASGISVVHGHGEARVDALRDVDLEVHTGDRVALWGRSGSGKTTLLHVLGGLVEPTDGSVEHGGESAFVFQGANLLPYFSAFENVAFAAANNDSRLAPAELLELVGLDQRLDNLPGELSGGEAQRVAIARALAKGSELLLCDEPTGQLDSDTGQRVLDLIDALQEELGFALVVATHDADVAARYDRTLTLADGRVLGQEVPA
jgi:putative ABC transport system ATP-binding protein